MTIILGSQFKHLQNQKASSLRLVDSFEFTISFYQINQSQALISVPECYHFDYTTFRRLSPTLATYPCNKSVLHPTSPSRRLSSSPTTKYPVTYLTD